MISEDEMCQVIVNEYPMREIAQIRRDGTKYNRGSSDILKDT